MSEYIIYAIIFAMTFYAGWLIEPYVILFIYYLKGLLR